MLIHQQSHLSFPERAAQLLGRLPKDGAASDRRQEADEAVDLLIGEYQGAPEADFARLGKAMARVARNDAVAETGFRTALSVAASGTPATGVMLASLATSILKGASVQDYGSMLNVACTVLKERDDIGEVVAMASSVKAGTVFGSLFGSRNSSWAQNLVLSAAAEGTHKSNVARSIVEEIDSRSQAGRAAKSLVRDLAEGGMGEEAKTYRLADELMDLWWNNGDLQSRDIGLAFLRDLPHDTAGRAQRLTDPSLLNKTLRAGSSQISAELKSQGDETWKYLELAGEIRSGFEANFSTKGIQARAIRLALGKVSGVPSRVGPAQLLGFVSEMARLRCTDSLISPDYHGWECFPSISEPLKSLLPEGSWRVAVDVFLAGGTRYGDFKYGSQESLAALGSLKPDQSPVLAMLAPLTCAVGKLHCDSLSSDQLGELVALAQSQVTDAHEVAALRKAQTLLATQGPQAVAEFLKNSLTPEVPAS